MITYKYLIIGGGMTGDAAVRGIRQVDAEGSIGLISDEKYPPYNRPPLSKSLWFGKPEDAIWRPLNDLNVELHLSCQAVQLDAGKKQIVDGQDNIYAFDKLLLATGGSAIRFPFGGDDMIYFRTLEDYRRLRKLSENKKRFAVIGGGFIGSEIAAALAGNQKEVVMIFPEAGVGANTFPKEISDHITNLFREKGVEVFPGRWVSGLEKRGRKRIIQTREGMKVEVDAVVAGIGIKPNITLAQQAGLEINRGIIVNRHLQTDHPDIYAAGDVAEFYNSALNRRLVVEHEENANQSGYLAGMAMAGNPQEYDYLPFFYSDFFHIQYQGVGEMSAALEIIIDWKKPFREGIIYYLKDHRVRGVVVWNIRKKIDAARKLIAAPGPFYTKDLMGRI